MSDKLELKKIIFLLLPLFIVSYMFTVNLIANLNSEELKFKVTLYDPYDIIRGRYLDITLEDTKVILPKFLTLYVNDEKRFNYQNNFILTYKRLNEHDKKIVRDLINDTILRIETIDTLYQNGDLYNLKNRDNIIDSCKQRLGEINYKFTEKQDYNFEGDILNVAMIAKQCNLDFFNLIETIDAKAVDYDTYNEYINNLEDKFYYVYYDVDENGYAKFETISPTRIKGKDNYIKSSLRFYNFSGDMIWFAIIDGSNKQFFIDERLAKVAEDAVRYAINKRKEVVIVTKLANGNMQISEILVDNINIFDYIEKYKAEKEKLRKEEYNY